MSARRPPTPWPHDALVTYHGWFDRDDDSHGIVAVEISAFGPTERLGAVELYRLSDQFGFHWGYTGSGPGRVTNALLGDALGCKPWHALHHAFKDDVVSQLADEWRMRRSALLRWVRGWVVDQPADQLPDVLPAVLAAIPPADPYAYEPLAGYVGTPATFGPNDPR